MCLDVFADSSRLLESIMTGIEAVVAFFLDSAESFEGFGFCRVRLWGARLPFCLKATLPK